MKRLSLIVNVLESYEVVRRQLLHLDRVLTPECELILVDDGSVPSLEATCQGVSKRFAFVLHCTNDRRPWTQPRARNIGARLATSAKFLFFDIDHIVTSSVIWESLQFAGDKLHWLRSPAILDDHGSVITDPNVLKSYGSAGHSSTVHANSFVIRRTLFERLNGYDERFCGQYGGDDIDFNERYGHLCRAGLAKPAEIRGSGHVFPDPARDVKRLFHSLTRAPN
jgi:Glycosyl transferase family 2